MDTTSWQCVQIAFVMFLENACNLRVRDVDPISDVGRHGHGQDESGGSTAGGVVGLKIPEIADDGCLQFQPENLLFMLRRWF